jgi:hypothetical protein
MLKVYEPPPKAGYAKVKCNRRLLKSRRLIEQVCGRLKGSFVFCSKNSFWNDFGFIREAIEACCGLHNFLEERQVDMPVDVMQVHDAQAMPQEAGTLAVGVHRSETC